jgi:ubiquinone/menaquinone biosynthesis C-methylase UbiE
MTAPLTGPRLWDRTAPNYLRDIAPSLSLFSEEALRLLRVGPGTRLGDVACGPGSLSFAAAARGARVRALDFSAEMIALLRQRAAREGVGAEGITAVVGDGQALPWPDGELDAVASLFGLIFFPDRARGLAELRRVLRPGGHALVASWVPAERVPILAEAWEILAAELPDLPYSRVGPPMGTPDEARAELGAAGFEEIEVHEVRRTFELPSAAEYWRSLERSAPPMLSVRESVPGERWAELSGRIARRVDERYGTGPFQVVLLALLSVGVR